MGEDYFNLTEVDAACKQLRADHPQQVRRLTLPELTHEGRAVSALRLSEDVSNAVRKPVFMIVGGLHGCEWGSCEIVINLAHDLLQGRTHGLDYGHGVTHSPAAVQSVLQGLDLLLVPLANPDGRFFAQTAGEFWRKNRSREQASAGPGVGVDLNRNFNYLFAESAEPLTSPFYAGPASLSEPEARNIEHLLQANNPDWFVDLHSGARCVVYPWSAAAPSAPMHADDVQAHKALGAVYATDAGQVSGNPVRVEPGFQFTSASGTSHDWAYARALPPSPIHGASAARSRTLAFSIEWSSDMVPLWFDMQGLMRETGAGLVAMCLSVLPGQQR